MDILIINPKTNMGKEKKYKLLKDLPDLKAGVIFERVPWKSYYINRGDYMREILGEQEFHYTFEEKFMLLINWFEPVE